MVEVEAAWQAASTRLPAARWCMCLAKPIPAYPYELGNKPGKRSVWIGVTQHANQERQMADRDEKELLNSPNINRRGLLKCMTWAGTGVVWTLSGGVPRTLGLIGGAAAETPQGALTFVQISDSHIG